MNHFLWRSSFFLVFVCFSIGAKSSPFLSSDSTLLDSTVIISKITVEGNKSTKQAIILRELLFHEGDTLQGSDFRYAVERSRENILNTSLFHFVDITFFNSGTGTVSVNIHVTERWYTWPFPILELADRNFNQWWLTRDFTRINYGFFLVRDNFRGRNEQVQLLFRGGYAQKFGLVYTIPYLNKEKKGGLSIAASYLRYHEIAYKTVDNKLLFYKDPDHYMRKELSTSASYKYRQGLYVTHYLTAEYHFIQAGDTIPFLNQDYFLNGNTTQKYFALSYKLKYDLRDLVAYPLKGNYFDIEFGNKWIGISTNPENISYAIATYKQYVPLFKKTYFAASLKGKLSGSATQPYFNVLGLGYGNDLVRGYELYVVDGQHYLLFRSTFKYNLLPTKIIKLEKFPLEKFNTVPVAIYFNLFADMGQVWNIQDNGSTTWTGGVKPTPGVKPVSVNPLDNSFLFGTGIGLDYVTYYNIVLRAEYSVNLRKEYGFRLAFTAPI